MRKNEFGITAASSAWDEELGVKQNKRTKADDSSAMKVSKMVEAFAADYIGLILTGG